MKVLIDGKDAAEFLGLMQDDGDWFAVVRQEGHGLIVRQLHPSRVAFVVPTELPKAESVPPTVTEQMTGNVNALRSMLRLVMTGQKIDAIKTVRMVTNCGLREAKEYVESWEWLLPYVGK